MAFALDERLKADSIELCDLSLCHVRLMNDARFPWLLLVPKREGAVELIDLADAERTRLMDEIGVACSALKALCAPHKLNVAALGNMVSQLHVHVIVRQTDDAAWPQPVWGHGVAEPYSDAERDVFVQKLAAILDQSPS